MKFIIQTINTDGVILSERKEDIKKKLETEKKLQDAIKKAKEKGIQNAIILPSTKDQPDFKNFELITNRNKISLNVKKLLN